MANFRRSFSIAALFIAALLSISCMNVQANHPGSVNAFDSASYDRLTEAQAAINQAKASPIITGNATAKATLNKVIASYNTAEHDYKAYHTAAVAGTVPDSTTLAAEITQLVSDVAALKAAYGGQ